MAKKNYTIPGHGTKIRHRVVENPSLAKGINPPDAPGTSPVAPIPANNTIQGMGIKKTKPGQG